MNARDCSERGPHCFAVSLLWRLRSAQPAAAARPQARMALQCQGGTQRWLFVVCLAVAVHGEIQAVRQIQKFVGGAHQKAPWGRSRVRVRAGQTGCRWHGRTSTSQRRFDLVRAGCPSFSTFTANSVLPSVTIQLFCHLPLDIRISTAVPDGKLFSPIYLESTPREPETRKHY